MAENKNDRPAAPVKPVNRFDAIFTGIIFKAASASAKTYDEGGRKTRKIANVLIEVCNSGSFLKGSVRAVQNAGEAKPHAEFGFFGAVNQGTCIVADDAQADADLLAFRAAVVVKFGEWRKKTGSIASVSAPVDALVLDDMGSL